MISHTVTVHVQGIDMFSFALFHSGGQRNRNAPNQGPGTGNTKWDAAIHETCAFPTMTCQNIYCKYIKTYISHVPLHSVECKWFCIVQYYNNTVTQCLYK